MRQITLADGRSFVTTKVLSYGDYDDSSDVERANVRFLEEANQGHVQYVPMNALTAWRLPDLTIDEDVTLIIAKGMFSSVEALLIDSEENRELINYLENDYPLIDEETLSEVENEMFQADWESWIKHDLFNAIGIDPDSLDDEKTLSVFFSACKETGVEYIIEAGGVGYIDIDALADVFKRLLAEGKK